MTVKKHFAENGAYLDPCMDQLVEVLAQLLDESADQARSAMAITNLHSLDTRAIHVMENSPEK